MGNEKKREEREGGREVVGVKGARNEREEREGGGGREGRKKRGEEKGVVRVEGRWR